MEPVALGAVAETGSERINEILVRGSEGERCASHAGLGIVEAPARRTPSHISPPLLNADDPNLVNAANLAMRRIERRERARSAPSPARIPGA